MKDKGKQTDTKSKLINMFAAMGEITVLVPFSYPLDTLKSRRQTNYYKDYKDFYTQLSNWNHNKNLYRGASFLYFGLMIRQPMKMVAFESAPTPVLGGIYASIAGISTGIPISFIKTNYQTNDKFKLDFKLAKKINMFKAWHYEIVKESIGNVAFFSIYGLMRKSNNHFGEKYIDMMNFVNGTFSSLIATFLAYPIDLMKARKQTIQTKDNFKQIFNSVGYTINDVTATRQTLAIATSFTDVGTKTFQIKNFWAGITPIFIRVSLLGGAGMFLYEKIKIKLNENF